MDLWGAMNIQIITMTNLQNPKHFSVLTTPTTEYNKK
jgi:hypothetical protein